MKELKDYLHLYLKAKVTTGGWMPKVKRQDCDIILLSVDWERMVSRVGWFYPSYESCEKSETYEIPTKDIKPILRPLSSMTEDEAAQYVKTRGYELAENIKFLNGGIEFKNKTRTTTWITFEAIRPASFLFLLSKHFDLFGLIEAGLAIDSVTTKTITHG